PSWVREAATSLPMKLMPTTTARRPGRASRLIASPSGAGRREWTPARAAPGAGLLLDRLAVGRGAQVVHAGQAGAGQPEPVRQAASGQQQAAVLEVLARAQGQRVLGGVDARYLGGQPL